MKEKEQGDFALDVEQTLVKWTYSDTAAFGWVKNAEHLRKKQKQFLKGDKKVVEGDKDYRALKKWAKKHVGDSKTKELSLPVGLNRYAKRYDRNKSDDPGEENFEELKKLLLTRREPMDREYKDVILMTAAILSSYLVRNVNHCWNELDSYPISKENRKALCITVKEAENAFYFVKKMARSLIVKTEGKKGSSSFMIKAPRVIGKNGEKEITDCAWLRYEDAGKLKWPAPYKDTSVVIDRRSIRGDKIQKFMDINPWCTVIVYGRDFSPNKGLKIEINGSSFKGISADWDDDRVRELLEDFVSWVPCFFGKKTFYFGDFWNKAGDYISRGREKGDQLCIEAGKDFVEHYKLRLMLATLIALFDYLQSRHIGRKENVHDLYNTVMEILLPGTAGEDDTGELLAKQKVTSLETFEHALEALCDPKNLDHIIQKKSGDGSWPKETEDVKDVWGYVTMMRFNKDEERSRCLVFIKKKLEKLPEIREIIGKDDLNTIYRDPPKYVKNGSGSNGGKITGKIELDRETRTSADAFIMKIEELPLGDEVKEMLRQKLTAY